MINGISDEAAPDRRTRAGLILFVATHSSNSSDIPARRAASFRLCIRRILPDYAAHGRSANDHEHHDKPADRKTTHQENVHGPTVLTPIGPDSPRRDYSVSHQNNPTH